MTYDWRNYLTFAERLLLDGLDGVSDGTVCRIAISRAYYAAFHAAQTFVQTRYYVTFGRKGVHYELKNWFLDDPNPLFRRVGEMLTRLGTLRTKADYYADFEPSQHDTVKAVNDARRLIELMAGL